MRKIRITLDFRGDVIIAGYVFKVISENPPEVELTYVTRADLKGIDNYSLPVLVVDLHATSF